jgi:putative SOS response-associated peptidase YedK
VRHWSLDTKISRHAYNARSETVAEKPSFREACRKRQRCIIPADAIYEPDWRTGKAVPTRILRADGASMGIAGLWPWWKSPVGDNVFSYTMLTINATDHGLMNRFHKSTDENAWSSFSRSRLMATSLRRRWRSRADSWFRFRQSC